MVRRKRRRFQGKMFKLQSMQFMLIFKFNYQIKYFIIIMQLISLEIGDFSTNVRGNLRIEFDEMVQIVKTHGQIIDSRASDKLNLKGLFL